jgi:S1-C subfamily serine protease
MIGETVIAIGNPYGYANSVSRGIVSALGREITLPSGDKLRGLIQTDAPINPGNSGGPLLNLDGEVIGVNAAIASQGGVGSGVGFSIPARAVSLIVPALIEKGHYDYPYLGALFDGEISLDEEVQYGLKESAGAYVLGVTPGSPAEKAGLIPADPQTGKGGDLVVAIDGNPVQDFGDLNSYLVFHTKVGQTVELTVVRDGRETTLSLTLGTRP